MKTSWRGIFGSIDQVAPMVVGVLRELDAGNHGVLTQQSVKSALALELGRLKPDESPDANEKRAENILAHIHALWTKKAGLADKAKQATEPAPVLLRPSWLADFTNEWGRLSGGGDKWDIVRRSEFEDPNLMKPTADPDELDRRVSKLVKISLRKPTGQVHPKKTVGSPQTTFERRPDVMAWVLRQARGKCECCGRNAPFRRATNGTPYLELHHAIQLAAGGPDTVENAVAVCPNCHRLLHHGKESVQKLRQLYQRVGRLVGHEPKKRSDD